MCSLSGLESYIELSYKMSGPGQSIEFVNVGVDPEHVENVNPDEQDGDDLDEVTDDTTSPSPPPKFSDPVTTPASPSPQSTDTHTSSTILSLLPNKVL